MTGKMRELVKGMILGVTGKPLPVSTGKTLVGYSYNGVVLPALPEWDKETYPYAVISELGLLPGYYNLHVLGKDSYYFNSGGRYFGGSDEIKPVPGYQCTSNIYPFDEWKELLFMDNANACAYENKTIITVWSNFDMLNEDGTIFMAASEPIPVYE